MEHFVKVGTADEVPPGASRVVSVDGRDVAIFNLGGRYYAIENVCPHRGGPVGEGDLERNVVTCPWHGWQFDITTGVSVVNPAARVTTFPVMVEGADLLVAL